MKLWTEARNNKYMKYHSQLTYQLSFWNVSRTVDYHAGGKWFIHGPKRHKENQLLSLKHPKYINFSERILQGNIDSLWRHHMEVFSTLGNSPVCGDFPPQIASNADINVSLMWVT